MPSPARAPRLSVPRATSPWWADAEPAQRFRDVIDRYAPDTPMGSTATGTWSTLELFRKAMKAHGPGADKAVDAAAVRDAYAQIKDETLDGLLPQPLTFGANTPQRRHLCVAVHR